MKLKDRIQHLLIKYPTLRDDVHYLITVIWKNDIKKMNKNIESMTALELLQLVRENKLNNVKTIDRLWRLVQRQNPSLRGEEWDERQGEEEKVRDEMANEAVHSP